VLVVLSIHPSRHPSRSSKFLIPEEEDDGTGGGRRLMAATTIYPHVHVILLVGKKIPMDQSGAHSSDTPIRLP
jgi:hypothetical protein